MNSVFSEQILADKLSKLNRTQQCIETLSHWCIFHRSKAELVVTTWEKQFHKSEVSQKVLLVYLANDILQNGKRKGNEFVTEFWKVLPAALKDLAQNGDESGKKAVTRLVDIWEERRIFGSRAQSLKDLMLGEELPPPLELNKKRPRAVRIAKRDSRSIRTKLTIGSAAEKIVSAFHSLLSEHPNEDSDMSNCQSAVHRVRKMEKDFDIVCADAKNPKRKDLAKELEGEENCLKECIEKLKSVEATRAALVSQLKEALNEQESMLENVRTQMQVAQAQAEDAGNMRRQLCDENYVANGKGGQTSSRKTTAAEIADKLLAASSSSQFIMTSVLSSLAAEEAKNAGFTLPSSSSAPTTTAFVEKNSTEAAAFRPTTPLTTSYQSIALPPQQTQTQQQYPPPPLLSTQPATTYLHQPSYGFNFSPAMSAATHPPGPHLVGPVPLAQVQSLPMIQQQAPPAAPSFRPVQPPGMLYYTTNLYPSR